ncbi:unnamed protein product [Cylindrotheca closterium]|uniref:Protein farnesyltransferase/geranylgeranyltransferase type-1 subunit alpha n=1 Tax=Cylindrotheca closterium TaxID=2856 RepID=A0AAD2CG16_9STRA|nr:unnamed protein product [Cylindrotheca closterium]
MTSTSPSTTHRMMIPADEVSDIFSDLTPVPQDEGPLEPVCAIQYPTSFRIAYDYMRAIWQVKEYSPRALQLAALCLRQNPANYTVWQWRRQCLKELGLRNDKEAILKDLQLTATLGGSNPKNYQIWYHRRALLESYGGTADGKEQQQLSLLRQDFGESELAYYESVIDIDSKNYHCWSNRQWFLCTLNDDDLWERELEYTEELIDDDQRNNSAWNQRWTVVHKGTKNPLSLEITKSEADFCLTSGCKVDPYNESPWRYLVALLQEQLKHEKTDTAVAEEMIREYEQKSASLAQILVDAQRDPEKCVNMTWARVDMLEMAGDKASLEQSVRMARDLETQHDVVRNKYWKLRISQLQEKLAQNK